MKNKEWSNRWLEFKKSLPHKNIPFSKRNWGSSLHSLCSYQGKLKPAIAHHLVNVFSNKGDVVLDPFSGSGTIPYEAVLNGRRAIGFDISDMSVAITNGKIKKCTFADAEKIIAELERYIEMSSISEKTLRDAKDISFNKTIKEYFEDETYLELLKARDYFLKTKDFNNPAWCLVFSSMLHILHGNRPYALSRRSHPLTPYAPTGDFERKPVVKHLSAKVFKSIEEQNKLIIVEGECKQIDILSDWSSNVEPIDAIITSPPFVASTKFYMTNWMRFWFAGWGQYEFNESVKNFVEVKQKKNIDIYKDIFVNFSRVLKTDGVVVLHVGKNKTLDMGEALAKVAKDILKVEDIFIEPVDEIEKHGLKDKGGTTEHQYIVLTKS
jgi:methylase of polypeptide subunit release factors